MTVSCVVVNSTAASGSSRVASCTSDSLGVFSILSDVCCVCCAGAASFAPVIVQPTAAAQSRSTRIRTGIAVFGCFVMEMMRVLSCPPRPDIVVAALRGSTRSRHVMRMSERP